MTLYRVWGIFIYNYLQHGGLLIDLIYCKTAKTVKYSWFSYKKVLKLAYNIGDGMRQLGIKPGDRVIICAPNSTEWLIADLACIFYGMVIVPLHFTLDGSAIDQIISDTSATCVITTLQYLPKFSTSNNYVTIILDKLSKGTTLQKMISFSSAKKNTTQYNLSEVLQLSKRQKKDKDFELPYCSKPSDIFTISYTSGSTGKPKGVVHTNSAYMSSLVQGKPEVVFVYCPLAHSERSMAHSMLVNGSRISVFEGEMNTLFEHVREVQPSHFSGPPRVWNKMFNDFTAAMALAGATEDNYFEVETKLLNEFSLTLGNRLQSVSTGSAPTGDAVLDFMRKCFKRVLNGYGTKEAGEVTVNNLVSTGTLVKLENFDEFKKTDLPYPRGEICVKTDGMASSYYNNPDETAEHFKDGWFHTGDIGQMMASGYLVIIGRKKQLFKLSQGEFVSPERVENVFQKSAYVSQIYVHGESLDSFLVSIVVPNRFQALEWAKKEGLGSATYEELCQNQKLIEAILSDMQDIAKQEDLRLFDIPRGLYLTPNPFTEENNQLTYSQKVNRTGIRRDYTEVLQQLLEKTRKIVELSESVYLLQRETSTGGLSVKSQTHAKLSYMVKKYLGVDDDKLDMFSTGVDSLAATQFVCQVRDSFKVDLPLKVLYTSKNLLDLAKVIDWSSKVGSPQLDAYFSEHPNDSMLPTYISGLNCPSISHQGCADQPKNGVVLLTGATGFLGAHLLYTLLTQTTSSIYCLVRKVDSEESAKNRVIESLKYYDIWDEAHSLRIFSVQGDLSQTKFGWSDDEFFKMAAKIDVIYHNGATVNSMLPFTLLRSQNVTSTQEILQLACSYKLKPVHYISSVSVFGGVKTSNAFSETDTPSRSPQDGYGLSKYQAENLCRQAAARGLPIIIYRPGSISGSMRTGGSNSPAFLNRLLCGITLMGEVPVEAEDIKLEMVPVDYVSKAIVSLSMQPAAFAQQVFHLVNPKTVSLASIANTIGVFYGTKLRPVPFIQWKHKIAKDVKSPITQQVVPNPLFPVLATHFPGSSFTAQQKFNDETTRGFLNWDSSKYQNITPDVINAYLAFYVRRGCIPRPQKIT